jgi:predicted PurR-regulated permease PerM
MDADGLKKWQPTKNLWIRQGSATYTQCIQLRMQLFDARAARVISTILMFVAGLAVVFFAWKTIAVLFFAMLFAYLMEPMVARVQKKVGKKRWLAVGITYLAFWIIVGSFAGIAGQRLMQQAHKATQIVPTTFSRITSGDIAYDIGKERNWSGQRQQRLHDFLAARGPRIEAAFGGTVSQIPHYAGALLWALLVPFLAMLFPKDKARLPLRLVDRFAAEKDREILRRIIKDTDAVLGDYMWAQFLLSVIAFFVFLGALWLLKVPAVLLLSLLAAVLEFIFVVGPLLAAIAILGTVVVSGKGNLIAVIVFLAGWRLVQDYVNTPLIFSAELRMPALAVVAAVLIGGEIGGGLGMFVAVPVAAVIRLLWRRWDRYRAGDEHAFQVPTQRAA